MKEGWADFYSAEDIQRLHEIELNSLDMLIDVCEILGIRFFMYGGSLLGTVKYSGFVPWDDDLDIAMLRDDYEKLIENGPSLLPEGYELQHPKINKRTPYTYIKLRRTDTALVEYRNHKVKINHGIYFDIYPIDNIPNDYADYLKQKADYDKWVSIFLIRQNFRLENKVTSFKDLIEVSVRFFQSMIAHTLSVRYIMKKIDAISTRYNLQKTLYQGNLTFPKLLNYFDGMKPVDAVFEHRKVYIPSGYEINLKNRYGDINRLPPENKRIGHKPYILDFGGGESNVH